jgi:hypothetical protein
MVGLSKKRLQQIRIGSWILKANRFQRKSKKEKYVKEHKREFNKAYYLTYTEECNKRTKNYYLTHKQKMKNLIKEWRQRPEGKVFQKRIDARRRAKRRKLGFFPLNEPFERAEGHHIDKIHVVFIPKELHNSIRHNVWTGHNMEKINFKTFEWIKTNCSI